MKVSTLALKIDKLYSNNHFFSLHKFYFVKFSVLKNREIKFNSKLTKSL